MKVIFLNPLGNWVNLRTRGHFTDLYRRKFLLPSNVHRTYFITLIIRSAHADEMQKRWMDLKEAKGKRGRGREKKKRVRVSYIRQP